MALELRLRTPTDTVIPAYCRAVRYEKRLTRSCTTLSGEFVFPNQPEVSIGQINRVEFRYNGTLLHAGLPDTLTVSRSGQDFSVKFTSRGFTSLLESSEAYPRINSQVDLASLVSRNITSSNITCEAGTPTVNFIYVPEGDNVWEAVTAYATKAVEGYPYIRGANKVCVTDAGSVERDYSDVVLLENRTVLDTRTALTDIYMKGLGDDYDYSAHNQSLKTLGYSRVKYIPLDQQWLNEPDLGLRARIARSALFMKVYRMTYHGYLGEELMDTGERTGEGSGTVGAITLQADSRGVFTTVDLI